MRRIGLGIDAGGTYTKILAVDSKGGVLRRSQVRSLPQKGGPSFVKRISRAVKSLERGLGAKAPRACLAIAGDVDPVRGVLRRSPNLPALEGFALRKSLSRALGRTVLMHNDANMAAWGCYAIELGRRRKNVIAITMGTGVGGGIVLGGKLWTGSTGSAAEIGHMRINDGGEPCNCGARGCLEAYASQYAIIRCAERLLSERTGGSLALRRKLGKGLAPHHLAEAALRGDPIAREVWERVGRALGAGIAGLVYIFNPDAVVFAGGVSQAGKLFLEPLKRVLRAESFRAPFDHVKVRIAKRSQLGSRGAALYSLEGD